MFLWGYTFKRVPLQEPRNQRKDINDNGSQVIQVSHMNIPNKQMQIVHLRKNKMERKQFWNQ